VKPGDHTLRQLTRIYGGLWQRIDKSRFLDLLEAAGGTAL
jgi:hypothetical protein